MSAKLESNDQIELVQKKLFKRNICEKNSSRKSHLKLHIAEIHEGIKSFKCQICDYRCSQKNVINSILQ